MIFALAGCVEEPLGVVRAADPGDGDSGDSEGADSGKVPGPCPAEMALMGVCVDRWEGTILDWSPYEVPAGGVAGSEAGVVPQGYISGDVAARACAAAGKRLCSTEEWMGACGAAYPYGEEYESAACNTEYAGGHPVCDYFGTCDGVWDMEHMNDPGINQQAGTVAETGEFSGCVTVEGVFDLHGNLHEWTADAAGTFKGGFYADGTLNGAGCWYTTTAHSTEYHDYSTGFRCCRDPEG